MSLTVPPARAVVVAGGETRQTIADTERRARAGDGAAQWQLAWYYREGVRNVLPKNIKRAVEWFAQAANNGVEEARKNLAEMYEFGEEVPQDHEKAKNVILEGPRGDPEGAAFIAQRYSLGPSPAPNDLRKAIEWYRLASELPGQSRMLCPLGEMYEKSGEMRNYEEAARWYRKAAELGAECGSLDLGRLYAAGKAVPQDSVAAAALYRAAGEIGSADLAHLYEEGVGVPQDVGKAVEFYHVDACQNYQSRSSLMTLFEKGHPGHRVPLDPQGGYRVPLDGREAFEWYRARARAGDPWGELGLALHYEYGLGVRGDWTVASALYSVASDAFIQAKEQIPNFTLGERCTLTARTPLLKDELQQLLTAIHNGTDLLAAIDDFIAHEPPSPEED